LVNLSLAAGACWPADWQLNRILSTRDGVVSYVDKEVKLSGAKDVFFHKLDGSWDTGPYGWLD
jgi:hypothetical protein